MVFCLFASAIIKTFSNSSECQLVSFLRLFTEFEGIEDGGSKTADTKMAISCPTKDLST